MRRPPIGAFGDLRAREERFRDWLGGRQCSTPPPRMHHVDPTHATRDLDYADMVALSEMFRRWAIHESDLTPENNTYLILLSADYERLAEWVGPNWRASDPAGWPTLLKFMATVERHHSMTGEVDDLRTIFANSPPPPANVPSGSQYSTRRRLWRTPNGVLYDRDGRLVRSMPMPMASRSYEVDERRADFPPKLTRRGVRGEPTATAKPSLPALACGVY